MNRILLPLILLLALSAGCATTSTAPSAKDTPLITAGKTLLAAKSTIVTAATATDALCKQHTLPADTCTQAKAAYEQSKPAYDSAVDAYLLTSQGVGDQAALDVAIKRLQDIALRILSLQGGAK